MPWVGLHQHSEDAAAAERHVRLLPAACHYVDGTFVPEPSQADCPTTAPGTGAAFFFWHPKLYTMHFWVWYPNPAGLYSSMNPLVAPFSGG